MFRHQMCVEIQYGPLPTCRLPSVVQWFTSQYVYRLHSSGCTVCGIVALNEVQSSLKSLNFYHFYIDEMQNSSNTNKCTIP